ncbi:mechanosensitive ion channel family protein [soil metagenome]
MNKILDQVFLDNSIRDYLLVAIIISIVLVLKTLLSKMIADLIGRMVVDKKRAFNRIQFRDLVLSPIKFFVIVFTVITALYRLKFPDVLNIAIYKVDLHTMIEALARAVLIFSFIWLCNRIVAYIAGLLHQRAQQTLDRADDQLIVFFRDFLKVIIWIIGILLVMKFSFGFALSNVFTGLSIVGAALALAFRESLENLIASFIIFFDKPFTVGDLVKIQTVNGTVEKIGLRSTRIRTLEKTFVTVPNKQMVDSILDNQSLRTQRNVLTRLELSKQTTHDQLKELITDIEALLKQDGIFDFVVYLSETGHVFHVLQVEYFVTVETSIRSFYKLRESVNLAIIKLLEEKRVVLSSGQA